MTEATLPLLPVLLELQSELTRIRRRLLNVAFFSEKTSGRRTRAGPVTSGPTAALPSSSPWWRDTDSDAGATPIVLNRAEKSRRAPLCLDLQSTPFTLPRPGPTAGLTDAPPGKHWEAPAGGGTGREGPGWECLRAGTPLSSVRHPPRPTHIHVHAPETRGRLRHLNKEKRRTI